MKKLVLLLASIALLLILSGCALNSSNTPSIVCTADTKACPDGTILERTGPNCEFEECQNITDTTDFETFYLEFSSYSGLSNSTFIVWDKIIYLEKAEPDYLDDTRFNTLYKHATRNLSDVEWQELVYFFLNTEILGLSQEELDSQKCGDTPQDPCPVDGRTSNLLVNLGENSTRLRWGFLKTTPESLQKTMNKIREFSSELEEIANTKELTLATDKMVYEEGETITISLTNNWNKPIYFAQEEKYDQGMPFEVLRDNNQKLETVIVSLKQNSTITKAYFLSPATPIELNNIQILPGQTKEWKIQNPTFKSFHETGKKFTTGKYKLILHYLIRFKPLTDDQTKGFPYGPSFRLESNKFEIVGGT
ncbi:MAG: hypothetical protein HY392_01840 [Candidatus Diapherotrites archaeon]|nr:hypothetical protein [Candidatus Diapherotrites archaeon]